MQSHGEAGRRRKQLAAEAYPLYEQFRPKIPAGKKGWGVKGDLDLGLNERLVKVY